jgi:hypothetical protein
MVLFSNDNKPSPEIKQLVEKMTPDASVATSQKKFDDIVKRKKYDHHCFLECVLLRLDTRRSTEAPSLVQTKADTAFTHMLTHAL